MKLRTVLFGGLLILSVALASCDSDTDSDIDSDTAPPSAVDESVESPGSEAPGLRATERFMATWNTRDPAAWASSLHFPHARPSVGRLRIWQTPEEYIAEVDFPAVIATGWDHTELEELRAIHEGESKAHVAGRWARHNAEGDVILRSQVCYIATRAPGQAEVDGQWGIQARFGAGAPLPDDEAGRALRQKNAESAIAKVEEYMAAFNARDPAAWGATLHYPHLRIAGGEVRVWETEDELVTGMDFGAFAERFGWHHSGWDEIEAVQVAEHGVNVALTFSRYNAENEVISTFKTLYLVTFESDRWGIRARSSFAP